MKSNTKSKTEFIKIRVNKQEKEKLKKIANIANESLSSYILKECLRTDTDYLNSLPNAIESLNLLNEICHEINKCNDEQLKNSIKNMLNKESLNEKTNIRKTNQ